MEKLEFTQKVIQKYLRRRLTPTQRVAVQLREKEITEEDFLTMPVEKLDINGPERIKIANTLREIWRDGCQTWRKYVIIDQNEKDYFGHG